MKMLVKLYQSAVALLACVPLMACAPSGGPIEGQVLEENTKKPIAGAIVVVRWIGNIPAFAESKMTCVQVESAVTDEQGKYRISSWRKSSSGWPVLDLQAVATAYKRGYGLPTAPSQKDQDVLLKLFNGTQGERLEYLLRVSSATRCGTADESEKNLFPLKRALYQEGAAIASTKEDQEKVETLLFGLESLEFGSIEALNRMTERRKVRK